MFCDKGAERKFRQEERRAARKVAVGGQRVLEMYHQVSISDQRPALTTPLQCQDRSEFYSMVDLSRSPVLYTPGPTSSQNTAGQPATLGRCSHSER